MKKLRYLEASPGPYLSGFTFACWLILIVTSLLLGC